MTASLKVLGGLVDRGAKWSYSDRWFKAHRLGNEEKRYSLKTMKELAVADETSGVRVLGAAGWGALGALVAGPVGAIVGGILGGRGKTVTFIGKFNDDKTMLAQVDQKTWLKMLAERV